MKTQVIKVDQLARVEGEGSLIVTMKDGNVADVKLRIFEPPRFFEAFLRGRLFTEPPDITARICGICPVAYQISSVNAIEDLCGVQVGGQLRQLRRLLYCGEWIESHVLHVFMLHAPDFLGYEDSLLLAKDQPALVENALRMKKAGNDIVRLLGGREIHPVNVRVGGWYKVPRKTELHTLLDPLKWARDTAIRSVGVIAGLEYPDLEPQREYVALSHPDEYAIHEGNIVSSAGLNIPVKEYEFHFEERHVAHSNALHSQEKGVGSYVVGPLARFNLSYDRLPEVAKQAARDAHIQPPVHNPFKSIAVRAVETVFAFDEAIRIIEQYEQPDKPALDVQPRPGIGFGASEAPRGLLYHRYRLNDEGLIRDAKIVPPTAQNLPTMEDDVRLFVTKHKDLPKDALTWKCEQTIRNYDPCISCATHFLRLDFRDIS
jgi:coenzyme F420-reducing hydrogenase alpha subunit